LSSEPSISVIIPIYNAADYVEEAIISIYAQKLSNMELIVVDDGSTDNLISVLNSIGHDFTYYRQEHQGPAVARNHGIEKSRGDIFAFLDADDFWDKEKMARQIPHLSTDSEYDIVIGQIQCVKKDAVCNILTPKNKLWEPWVSYSFGSALIRKQVFDKIGLLDPTMFHGEDLEWFLRARDNRISILTQSDVTLYYRLHDHNMSHDRKRSNSFMLNAYKKSLDRRRNR
jgi:glycosyltransferase involved in cell wall biosynthesis